MGTVATSSLSEKSLAKYIGSGYRILQSLFYDLSLRPLEITHTYRTRTGSRTFRQPMIMCEVDRRGIINQMVQMDTQIDFTEFNSLQLISAVCIYRKQLLIK